MAKQVIENNDLGSIVRSKINGNFDELYDGVVNQNWVADSDYLRPTENLGIDVIAVLTELLNVNNQFNVDSDGKITSGDLANQTPTKRRVVVDTNGLLTAEMLYSEPATVVFSNTVLTEDNGVVIAIPGVTDLTLTLPDATTHLNKAFLIRKMSGMKNVIIQAAGSDVILSISAIVGADSHVLYDDGEWVMLRSMNVGGSISWVIEANAGSVSTSNERELIVLTDNHNLLKTDHEVMANATKNIEISLPAISSVGRIDYPIRKIANNAFAVTLLRSGMDSIVLNQTLTQGITTTEVGAWVRLVSNPKDNYWYVVEGGENWTEI